MIEGVFTGNTERYNNVLKHLANMAEPEKWTYASVKETDPYRILRNYFEFTYCRLAEEDKLLVSQDNEFMCMNTGLLTIYNQEIVALFSVYTGALDCKWYLKGFYKDSDYEFTNRFQKTPQIADFSKDVRDLVYDKGLDIVVQKEHIIEDNYIRFAQVGYTDRALINVLLDAAVNTIKLKLSRNYKLAIPFYYHNTETDEKKIQLLAPLYFPGAPVRLALVLDRVNKDECEHYEAITVLPVEWAYMNARVIVRPEDEWAKIIDDVLDVEENDECNSSNTMMAL